MNNIFGPGFSGFMAQKQMNEQEDMNQLRRMIGVQSLLGAREEMKAKAFQNALAMQKQRVLQSLLAQSQPQPLAPQALAEGAAQGDIGPTQTNAARLTAMEQNPVNQGYTPIPPQRLAQAAVGGVNIDPFLKLNAEARPDVLTVDLGDKIRYIDKKTMRPLGEVPKGAAPGSRPFEASDIDAPTYRAFLEKKAKAGATVVQPDPLGLTPKDRFEMEGKLRDDFRNNPTVKAADEMDSAFRLITAAYQKPSAANDLAMATKYMKILDPTSVVRESEFALAVNATGLLDKVQNYSAAVLEGKKLNPTQRKDFYDSARSINDAFQAERDKLAERFTVNAKQYNLTPENVVGPARQRNTPKPTDNKEPALPQKGDVVDGYEFLGGIPSNRMNWRKK